MGKIKQKHSLKFAILKYLPPCLILSMVGILIIGHGTNYLQTWHMNQYSDKSYFNATYWLISNAQILLMPLWVLLCAMGMGMIFYRFEMKKPIDTLLSASQKIADYELDFKVEYKKDNELGTLCSAFENMRQNLYDNNLAMWRSLEERKRLNSAFSHDLRTPLTVLRGYVDFLQKYDSQISPEKQTEILSMMNSQITRLEHYTQKMNSVQKLEDITPKPQNIPAEQLKKSMQNSGKILCVDKNFVLDFQTYPNDSVTANGLSVEREFCIDYELVMQIYENLLANACRYAKSEIRVDCTETTDKLILCVQDDGQGFSEEALQKASQPFFRDEKDSQTHFGLGLYICRILCEKCGGTLMIENDNGGTVTAEIKK